MVNINGVIGNESGEVNLLSVIDQVQREQGENIEVNINSIGGDLDVGFSIYNYLLNLPQTVTTICSGNCASAASIVFLAGDIRIAGCPIMIHNPYIVGISGDREELQAAADWIGEAETQLEKAYAERTKLDVDTLSELMKAETYLSPSQAVTLGFATQAKTIALAKLNKSNINKNDEQMSEKKTSLGSLIREALGLKPKQEKPVEDAPKVYNMDLTTATGDILSVDREEGAPQVGDSATPDGVHTMADGSVITVDGGVIVDIVVAENESDIQNEEGGDIIEEVAKTLEDVIAELQAEVEDLKGQLVASNKLAKTSEEIKVLNAVKMAGGLEKLAKGVSSSYKPKARVESTNKSDIQTTSPIRERIEKIKNEGGDK